MVPFELMPVPVLIPLDGIQPYMYVVSVFSFQLTQQRNVLCHTWIDLDGLHYNLLRGRGQYTCHLAYSSTMPGEKA